MSSPVTPSASNADWLAQTAQAIEELLWVWDASTGRVLLTNAAFERFWGHGAQALGLGREALLDRIHPDDRERIRRARQQLDHAPYGEEYRVTQPASNGKPSRTARLRERAFRARGPGGEAWVTHVARDVSWQFDTTAQLRAEISRRTDAERNLNDATQRLQALIATANDSVITIDERSSIIDWNNAAERMFGWRREEALGQTLTELIVPPAHRKHHTAGIERFLVDGSGQIFNRRVETTALRRGGEEFQIEQDMLAALARERELSELKSRFVAVASHEFRTPLAAILSSVELLDDYGPRLPEEERKEIVGLVKNAVARMNKMVEQVLITSRLESGKFSFEPQARSIPQLLVQVASEMDQANPQASRIAMQCDGVEQARLVDPKLFSHILVNLLGNALKYSPPDSAVTCIATAEGERLRLSIADRGIGIPAADLPRLFESFHRGTNVGNIQGTGIGLHIVKECVELHRGSIEVESGAGEGATFHVRLHAPLAS